MAQLAFNEKLAEQMQIIYRSRDILRRRRLVYEALGASPGERILDVGCGPGFYASELLDQVGDRGSVVALDASEQMLAVAAHRCEGRPNVSFHPADATALPVEDGGFECAVSVQVLEYVPEVDTALREIARALPRTLSPRMRAAGFEDVRMEGHAFASTELTSDAYGSALLPLMRDYVAGVDGIGERMADEWVAEQHELHERGAFYFSCTQFCFTGVKGVGDGSR